MASLSHDRPLSITVFPVKLSGFGFSGSSTHVTRNAGACRVLMASEILPDGLRFQGEPWPKARDIAAVNTEVPGLRLADPHRFSSQTRQGWADMELVEIFQAGFSWLADGVAANATLVLACILIDTLDAALVKERMRRRQAMSPVAVARRAQ